MYIPHSQDVQVVVYFGVWLPPVTLWGEILNTCVPCTFNSTFIVFI